MDRRNFLKSVGIFAGGLLLGKSIIDIITPKKSLKYPIVGYGKTDFNNVYIYAPYLPLVITKGY